jgi:hypothetical protein
MTYRRPISIIAKFFLLLSAFCLLPSAYGQSSTATLSGSVEDQNTAAIPGVTVTVVNKGTMATRETTTNESGYFTVPLLPPGNYIVRARRDGFAPIDFSEIVLNVGDNKALQIQLKAGDVNAQVTIDSSSETVRTDGSVGTVVNRQFVSNMPLNGRSLQALIQLTPGVVLTPIALNQGSATGNGQFSVNGQRTTSNYFMVDGLSANTGIQIDSGLGPSGSGQTPGTTALGGTNSLVSLDALQEFRVDTSTYAAEYGRTPGGQISLLSRSGTNDFHGSASYYLRNEVLDANDWFANSRRLPKPKERQNLFGGVLGGPIKSDRLFFFGSYEGLRLKQPRVVLGAVPTVALRAQAAPVLRPYLNAFPLPSGRDFGNGTAEFAASYSNPGEFNIFSLRLDGRVASNVTGFFRFSHGPSHSETRALALSTVQSLHAINNAYSGGVTWIAGPRLTADVRVNWTRNEVRRISDLDTFGGAVIPNVTDIFAPGRDPSNSQFQFRALNDYYFEWGQFGANTQRQFNVVGSVGWSVGTHQLKFGLDYRRTMPLLGGKGTQAYEFLSSDTVAQVVGGLAHSYSIANTDAIPREPIFSNWSLYVQDAWHAGRRLTLTYGLRFERVPPPTEASGRIPPTVLGIESDVLGMLRLAPEGTPLWRSRAGEVAPRFGIAYQLNTRANWGTTVRGGTGVFYDLDLGGVAYSFFSGYPYVALRKTCCDNISLPLSAASRIPPTGADPPDLMHLMDPNVRLPYTIQWNGTLEQGLGSAQTLTIGYVGAAGHRLLIAHQYDGVVLADFPNTASTLFVERPTGRSTYRALQVQYQRRLERGLQALASYTLARSRDNASQSSLSGPTATLGGLLDQEYGPSDFDVRHVLSAAVSYNLPRVSGPIAFRAPLNDWGLDLLVRYQSAFPVTPIAGFACLSDGTCYLQRPDLVSGQPLYIDDPAVPGGRRFNRAAFLPTQQQQGNFQRNGLRGFPASQVDLALRREFKLRESLRLQLRAELFNLFNHPNFGPPVPFVPSGLFGQPQQMLNASLGGLNSLYQMGGPRSGQLAIKILW